MPLRLRVLCSGSTGNLSLLEGDGGERILIDVGVRPSLLFTELAAVGVHLDALSGAVLTHAHGDHANEGSLALLATMGVPVHATAGTWAAVERRVGHSVRAETTGGVAPGAPLAFGGVQLHACRVSHDDGGAGDAVCYRAEGGGEAIGYATDLGTVGDAVLDHLRGVGLLVLESNHDLDLLAASDRPAATKAWIRGDRGHLRNEQSAAALAELFRGREGAAALLAHISGKANTPDRALACAQRALRGRADITLRAAAGAGLRAGWTVRGGRATEEPYRAAEGALADTIALPPGVRMRSCGRCGGIGHNRQTCQARTPVVPLRAAPAARAPAVEARGGRRAYRCSSCGETGHNAATCARRAAWSAFGFGA
jgi:phosphoribosyl 1,2-cyclic phosphodiesterase